MDKLDSRILYHLDLDARASLSKIAKSVRTTKQVVSYRMKNLEKDGIIQGYAAVVNKSTLGKPIHLRIYFVLQNITESKVKVLVDYLNKNKSVSVVAQMDGDYELVIALSLKDNHEISVFLSKLRAKFSNLISESVINIQTSANHLPRSYLIGKKLRDTEPLPVFVDAKKTKLDKTDLGILTILANNARTKSTVIASKLNVSPLLVVRRIRRLEKEGTILGYRLVLSKVNIGYKLLISLKNVQPARYNALVSYLSVNPNVTNLSETLGLYDLDVGLETDSYDLYRKIRIDLRNNFSDIIKRIVGLSHMDVSKYTYVP